MYQALYRKWRPKTFDDVVGQDHITQTLKNQVSTGRLSHAYLFIGTRGTGKTSCAKILAKAVNCEQPVDGNPCNVCSICRGIDDGSIMDVVEMDAASNNGVDNVRQLRDEAVFSPATAKKRVYIVDEVHMLSGPAFNALLKILEEPPAHLMFILATTELSKVPATILSRCQRHSFKRLDLTSIVGRLEYVASQEQIDLTSEAAGLIASLSEGGMRDALSMLDQCAGRERIDIDTVYSALGLAGKRQITQLLQYIAGHDTAGAVSLFGQLWQGGKDPATVLGELATLQRDLLLRAVAPRGGGELLSGGYDAAALDAFRDSFSTGMLVNNINLIQTALGELRSGQARTVCELALISLCEPDLGDSVPMLRERVAELERWRRSAATPAPVQMAPVATPPQDREPEMTPPPPDDGDTPPFDLPETDPISNAEPQPAPAPAPLQGPGESVPDGDGGDFWVRLCRELKGSVPVGIAAILTDPMQVSGSLAGDELILSIQSGFASNMVDRPDLLQKLALAAGELAGCPITVRTGAGAGERTPEDAGAKLDALKKFEIVQFK